LPTLWNKIFEEQKNSDNLFADFLNIELQKTTIKIEGSEKFSMESELTKGPKLSLEYEKDKGTKIIF